MSILKIEAFSGASGDMFLGALAGLANAYDELTSLPKKLNLDDKAEIIIQDTKKNGIACKQVLVKNKVEEHAHRHLKHIIEIINNSGLTDNTKKIAVDIFNIIGKAEAEVHGVPVEKIHFHEVGAIDSIIDVIGAAWLIDKLEITETYSTPLTTGSGFVNTAHGLLPVPCPATKLILEGLPNIPGDEEGERLTPTGAAIIKYLNPNFNHVPLIDIKTSYGPGEKNFKTPNVLRLSLCEKEKNTNEIIVIQTNLDDYNPEFLGNKFQEKLLSNGALDFYYNQVIMKKGRPGLVLTVLCVEEDLDKISKFILSSTPTIGLRYYKTGRIELERKVVEFKTDFGTFKIKIAKDFTGKIKVKPESEDVLNYSLSTGLNPNEVSLKIIEAYEKENHTSA